MNLDRYMKRSWHALAGALALAATAALANPVASQASIPQDSMRLALADSGQTGAEAVGSATPRSYPAKALSTCHKHLRSNVREKPSGK